MYNSLQKRLKIELDEIRSSGRYKAEREITSAQNSNIKTLEAGDVINFCANNYLGLASNDEIKSAAKESIDTHGFGLASVRFICGTQDIHKKLERSISNFLGTEDTILYAAAFDANGGLFEPLDGLVPLPLLVVQHPHPVHALGALLDVLVVHG